MKIKDMQFVTVEQVLNLRNAAIKLEDDLTTAQARVQEFKAELASLRKNSEALALAVLSDHTGKS